MSGLRTEGLGGIPALAHCLLILAICGLGLLPFSYAQAEQIVPTPSAHDILLGQNQAAGQAQTLDFEGLPFGTSVTDQFLASGVEFEFPFAFVILPGAFGSLPQGSRLAAVGFDPLQDSEVTLLFPEPQLAIAARFVDVGDPLQVEASLDGVLVETFFLEAAGEDVDGGIFRGIWFDGYVDEVRFVSADVEDGFCLDDLQFAIPGSVDNDGDGFSDLDGDCLDNNPSVNPAAFDDCDGFDTDCDGLVDEDDDQDGDGVLACQGDCDDDDPTIFPGATEFCDGIDQDCNGVLDDPPDLDGDGFDVCEGDCDDTTALVIPGGAEICDGLDNDCDGVTDESPDADGDSFSICDGDCDDTDPQVFPGQGCDPPVGDDDDASGDDDDASGDDDDAAGDDDDTSAGDDDDSAGGDDDDSVSGDDDDTSGSGDDDDTTGGGDDDDATGDDDDATGDDDDTSGGGDDDDTIGGDDDDTAGDDDDSAGDDDDSAETWSPPGPEIGIAGGGCACGLTASEPFGSLWALVVVGLFGRQRRGICRRRV